MLSVGDKNQAHETLPTHHRYGIVHLWMHDAGGGLPLPTIGRDTSLRPHRLWRNPHLQRKSDRDRLQVPV